jgi:hypothetical protein
LEGAVDKYPSLKAFSGDAGYRGTAVEFTSKKLGMTLHISEKIEGKWAVLPKRWVVERTFSWLGNFRRLSNGKAFVFLSMRLMPLLQGQIELLRVHPDEHITKDGFTGYQKTALHVTTLHFFGG